MTRAYVHGEIFILTSPEPNECGGSGVPETQLRRLVKDAGHMLDFIFKLGILELVCKDGEQPERMNEKRCLPCKYFLALLLTKTDPSKRPTMRS